MEFPIILMLVGDVTCPCFKIPTFRIQNQNVGTIQTAFVGFRKREKSRLCPVRNRIIVTANV